MEKGIEKPCFEALESRLLLDAIPITSAVDVKNLMGNPQDYTAYVSTLQETTGLITKRTLGLAWELNSTTGLVDIIGAFENNPNAPWWMHIPPERFPGFLLNKTDTQPGLLPGEVFSDKPRTMTVFRDIDGDGVYAYFNAGTINADPDDVSGVSFYSTVYNFPNGTIVSNFLVPGDVTLDGKVDDKDLERITANFGLDNRLRMEGELNNDGYVTEADRTIVMNNFGAEYIPEPATAAILGAGALALVSAKRRREKKDITSVFDVDPIYTSKE